MEELQEHLDNISNLKADLEQIKVQIEQETKLAKKAYTELGKEYDLVSKKTYNKSTQPEQPTGIITDSI